MAEGEPDDDSPPARQRRGRPAGASLPTTEHFKLVSGSAAKAADESESGPPTGGGPERLWMAAVADLFQTEQWRLRFLILGIVRNRDTADEILQVVFVKLLERGAEVAPAALRTWLRRVAANEAITWLRRERRVTAMEPSTIESQTDRSTDPAAQMMADELHGQLRAAIEDLPAEQRDVLLRRVKREQKFVDIAADLNVPLGTVLTRMRLAMAKLARSLPSEDV